MTIATVIGSHAMRHWYPNFREPKDLDLICQDVGVTKIGNMRIESHWNPALQELVDSEDGPGIIGAHQWMLLKFSHAPWDVNWQKTMNDLRFYQHNVYRIFLNQKDKVMVEKLRVEWDKIHGKKKVNLNQPVDQFFTSYVTRKIPHDDLHAMVSYPSEPMYKKIIVGDGTAMVSEDKWDALLSTEKFMTAVEELSVIAIERYNLTKHSTKVDVLRALSGAYKKLVTTMTKGFFCDYLILTHHYIMLEQKVIADNIMDILKRENYE